jgi:nucleotide-binding universal stress UspA family protein
MKGAPMKRILVPTHGSPAARRAVEAGLEIASAEGAAVTFLHVLPPTAWTVHGRSGGSRAIPRRLDAGASDGPLSDAADLAQQLGVDCSLDRISGEAAEVIPLCAEATGADLVVIGSPSLGSIGRLKSQGVSSAMRSRATCAVLVVRADDEAAETKVAKDRLEVRSAEIEVQPGGVA